MESHFEKLSINSPQGSMKKFEGLGGGTPNKFEFGFYQCPV